MAALAESLKPILRSLPNLQLLEDKCAEASVEEVGLFTFDDLTYEGELLRDALSKQMAFVQNQIVARTQTNLTPAQLEEFVRTCLTWFISSYPSCLGERIPLL